jgi:predicted metallo-beta-lactamase superfamily hydrolase
VILKIIGTESLGVRGMCCLVQAGEQRIVIDPGVALGYMRHGLLPHPAQISVGIGVRQAIIEALVTATDVVFSHFHGDHVPLREANPYQLSLQHMAAVPENIRCWSASWKDQSTKMQQRALDLAVVLGNRLKIAEGCSAGTLSFSPALPHGLPQSRTGTVMMTRVSADGQVFVHGSDIQLLGDQAVDTILQWQPDTVFISGPPLYRQSLSAAVLQQAWKNGLLLAENVETLIIDHHLLRSKQGLSWLDELCRAAGKKILCAADFMHRPRLMLEARRTELYRQMEVPENWHQQYEQGKVSVNEFAIKHEMFS